MKKPKYRVKRVAYRHRVKCRVKRKNTASNNTKPTVLLDHTPTPHTEHSALQPQLNSNLATFNSTCNPYQQFVDNLSIRLTNLPQEAFTQTPVPLADSWQKEANESPSTADLDSVDDLPVFPVPFDEDENLSQRMQKEANASKTEDTNKLANNNPSLPIKPNLQNLLGIVSCLLASNH